jgi:hypothetical protein
MVQVKIKETSLQAKRMIEYLKTLSYVEFIDIPNQETREAIRDARNKKVTPIRNSQELFKHLKA